MLELAALAFALCLIIIAFSFSMRRLEDERFGLQKGGWAVWVGSFVSTALTFLVLFIGTTYIEKLFHHYYGFEAPLLFFSSLLLISQTIGEAIRLLRWNKGHGPEKN